MKSILCNRCKLEGELTQEVVSNFVMFLFLNPNNQYLKGMLCPSCFDAFVKWVSEPKIQLPFERR